MENEKTITPIEYFNNIKGKKEIMTDDRLLAVYDNCLQLFEKYKKTNQINAMKKLMFQVEMIEKERQIIKVGIDSFVYRDDVEDFIENISDKAVKIIEMSRYEREIPDEIVETVQKVKDLFDEFYIVFTDYTGSMEKQVAQERKEKDPILFGAFQNKDDKKTSIMDRFYYIGDWEDEYCDLTLEKMVSAMAKQDKDIVRNISTPVSLDELKLQLKQLEPKKADNSFKINNSKPKGFLNRVKTFIKRG
jgi:hypothetical protein